MITSFNLYEDKTNLFDFSEYAVAYNNVDEGLYFFIEMQKMGYDFYKPNDVYIEIENWECFVCGPGNKLFVLARLRYSDYKELIVITVDEALKMATGQNKNNIPVIRWYKKGKLEKDGNN